MLRWLLTAALAGSLSLPPVSNATPSLLGLPPAAAPRAPAPAPGGPALEPLAPPPAPRGAAAAVGWSSFELPCDLFDPGKADPSAFMATSTFARQWQNGGWVHGYDPMSQSYDLMASGYADEAGYLLQETVGVFASPLALPEGVGPGDLRGVELWFQVEASNLYDWEWVGLVELDSALPPSSSLGKYQAQALYEDARGLAGQVWFLGSLPPGPHAIDLGAGATAQLAARASAGASWFGVGAAADGWDLGGSLGQLVFWRVAGGGSLPAANRPFFRVLYNAAPLPPDPLQPADGATGVEASPTFGWAAAADPEERGPVQYTLLLAGAGGTGEGAAEFDVGTSTQAQLPFALAPGSYHWRVRATDADGASTLGPEASFAVAPDATGNPPLASTPGLRVWPNPANPRCVLGVELASGQWARVELHDLRGRPVRTLHDGPLPAGPSELRWDGTDAGGAPVASGRYVASLVTAGGQMSQGVVLVR